MRLIDADKAKIILWEYSRFSGIDEAPYEYADEAIDILPTVDAIPVEWFTKVMGAVNNAQNYEAYEILNWLLDLWKNNKESFM